MADKDDMLKDVRKEIQNKMKDQEKNKVLTGIYGRIISTLAKRLIKFEGYSVANTIIKREIRELGRQDAKLIADSFGIDNTPEGASKTLKIAATLIGYDLSVEDGETMVKGCPFARMAIEMKEPTLCNICSEYVNGIIEGVLGDDYAMKATHDITQETPCCYFKLKKI